MTEAEAEDDLDVDTVEDAQRFFRAVRWSLAVLVSIAILAGCLPYRLRPQPTPVVTKSVVVPEVRTPPKQAPPHTTFKDITASSGLRFVHKVNDSRKWFYPEAIGGGGGFVDVDGDGDQDIVLVNSGRVPEKPS